MTSFRISVTILAVIHAVFAGFTALVGAFANGGDVWQRLLVVLLHPLGATGLLLLVLRPCLATTKILAMMALLTANVIADLWVAQMISAGRVRGDWELALAFSVVPAIGIVYALALLRTACAFYLFIRQPHGSEVSPAARNGLDSAPIPTASKLLICGLFQKGRVLAQDGIETRPTERTSILASTVSGSSRSLPHRAPRGRIHLSKG